MITLHLPGCSGGIGGPDRRTTCYLLDERVLIDAGTGLGSLSLEAMARIDHVVLTHAHLDHVACLPLLIDAVAAERSTPLAVWALPEVIGILRTHLFNDQVWPDFTRIPTTDAPFLTLHPLPDSPLELHGLRFTPLPARHGIPACGFRVQKDETALAFTGDTADCPEFWQALANDAALAAVVIECSYPKRMAGLAELSMHLHAGVVAQRLAALPAQVEAVIIHRKPGLEDEIAHDLREALPDTPLRLPQSGAVLRF